MMVTTPSPPGLMVEGRGSFPLDYPSLAKLDKYASLRILMLYSFYQYLGKGKTNSNVMLRVYDDGKCKVSSEARN